MKPLSAQLFSLRSTRSLRPVRSPRGLPAPRASQLHSTRPPADFRGAHGGMPPCYCSRRHCVPIACSCPAHTGLPFLSPEARSRCCRNHGREHRWHTCTGLERCISPRLPIRVRGCQRCVALLPFSHGLLRPPVQYGARCLSPEPCCVHKGRHLETLAARTTAYSAAPALPAVFSPSNHRVTAA